MPAVEDFLATPLRFLKGVGPQRAADLARAGLETVDDLLHRFPYRYEDRVHFAAIATLRVGQEPCPILGEIVETPVRYTRRRGFKIFDALVRDHSGALLATWPNQTYLQRVLVRGKRVVLYGKLEYRPGGVQMSNPDYEVWSEDHEQDAAEPIHSHRIVPIYRRTGQVSPRQQRSLVFGALSRLPQGLQDPLPEEMRVRLGLPGRYEALWHAHFPPEGTSLALLQAWRPIHSWVSYPSGPSRKG
jgi:ATP-dependent DNA helicase RecG